MFSDLSSKENSIPTGIEMHAHLLLVSASLSNGNDVERILLSAGYRVSCVDSVSLAKQFLSNHAVDLILLDMAVMTEAGPAMVQTLAGTDCVILVNEHQAYLAAEAMRAGAIDYIIKPFSQRQILDVVRGALRLRQAIPNLIATSPQSLQVLQLARRAAKTSATILIGGESGTGKERLARYIHESAV